MVERVGRLSAACGRLRLGGLGRSRFGHVGSQITIFVHVHQHSVRAAAWGPARGSNLDRRHRAGDAAAALRQIADRAPSETRRPVGPGEAIFDPLHEEPAATLASQTNYITRAGFEKLTEELDWLWREERPRVTEAVATAAALGDRSENADYIYGKKRLREIDRRIRFLTKRIDELNVVDAGPRKDADRIYFGAWVELEDEDGETVRYQLVGPDEFDAKAGRISVDSPVGRALMGKRLGDEVSVRRPKGEAVYCVLSIAYEEHPST
jgi:transcription elongation factor GreB